MALRILLIVVVVAVRLVVIVLERLTEPKIMRTRLNRGGDEFFAWEREHAGETELEEVLNPTQLRL
jgi:hypothetical protein